METQVLQSWFEANPPAAEWAAAIVIDAPGKAAAVERLRAHVARWAPGIEARTGFYGPLLRTALDRIDYGAVVEALISRAEG